MLNGQPVLPPGGRAAVKFRSGLLKSGSVDIDVDVSGAQLVFLIVTWVRWSFVRIRVDQILAISWKLLLPLTLLLLMVTAFLVARSAGGA